MGISRIGTALASSRMAVAFSATWSFHFHSTKGPGKIVGTLASKIVDNNDIINPNIVKVHVNSMLKDDAFIEAKDFFRIKKDLNNEKIYHHIGIYAFTNIALTKYVKLPRSHLELERNLEQMRAIENNMVIKVGLSDSIPLSVDNKESLAKVKQQMS